MYSDCPGAPVAKPSRRCHRRRRLPGSGGRGCDRCPDGSAPGRGPPPHRRKTHHVRTPEIELIHECEEIAHHVIDADGTRAVLRHAVTPEVGYHELEAVREPEKQLLFWLAADGRRRLPLRATGRRSHLVPHRQHDVRCRLTASAVSSSGQAIHWPRRCGLLGL